MNIYDCLVCGVDVTVARVPWHAIDTAAGLRFVCDSHSPADVRDAVAPVKRPERKGAIAWAKRQPLPLPPSAGGAS